MKLLVTTQVMDSADPGLGFFVRWVEELSLHAETIEVICLFEGAHALPPNVRVHSLGKENGRVPGIAYALRYLRLAWKLRGRYDAAFVHMNQEYIIIAGWLWKLLGKRIYLWRNHYAGSVLTDIAAAFCTKVFCTSKHSYTARYRKTVLMPVGIDTERFRADPSTIRIPRSILFLARIAPSKRADMFIEALGMLKERGEGYTASIYGSALPEDEAYLGSLNAQAHHLGLDGMLSFHPGPSPEHAPRVFAAHEIFVNCSPSGMFDKTLFEAAAAGCIVVASSEDFSLLLGRDPFSDAVSLASQLAAHLEDGNGNGVRSRMYGLAADHSLERLAEALVREWTS